MLRQKVLEDLPAGMNKVQAKRKHGDVQGPVDTQAAKAKRRNQEREEEAKGSASRPHPPSMDRRVFFSKSKEVTRRALSNFQTMAPGSPIVITQAMLEEAKLPAYQGSFASIEHFYQGMKFYSIEGVKQDKARAAAAKFLLNGEYGQDSKVAKSKGGKGAMKALGLALDPSAWNRMQDQVMRVAIRARAAVDPVYAAALRRSAQEGWLWLHFDRAGAKSYWGGHISKDTGKWVGRNRLGELMSEVGQSI